MFVEALLALLKEKCESTRRGVLYGEDSHLVSGFVDPIRGAVLAGETAIAIVTQKSYTDANKQERERVAIMQFGVRTGAP